MANHDIDWHIPAEYVGDVTKVLRNHMNEFQGNGRQWLERDGLRALERNQGQQGEKGALRTDETTTRR